ncbi:hypothetical protein FXV77_13020 [Sphingobacterium phlebotomi]|uniref:DUF4905 domain-containing protein n=1 Tax=Sphingobacterium phlebotomi TaxID=2605433 RepID=A0A5D4H4Y4_9SPHI|nr:hypothetical protein [Sphingobacterium phlebotomi]TYR35313.1 hypothetical protein FXV77_13020 [Sphingobacterium phlebotomi]
MTKYTTFKAFEKNFPYQIWKIVADAASRQFAVELRDTESTYAILYVFDFDGKEMLKHRQIDEKEWTLEAIQHHTIVLKRVGDTQPVKEGILFLDMQGNPRHLWQEYTWIDTYRDVVKVRHRNFQSGFEEYIDIETLKKTSDTGRIQEYCSAVKMPVPYNGALPPYLQHIAIQDLPWISRAADHILWSYHTKEHAHYHLNLSIADTSKLLSTQCLLSDMPKMIPQPYFQIENQIFLMSYNKRKIVSYLV